MLVHNNAIADLHIHTKESDGNKTPHKIITPVKGTKLKNIALTDHHTTRGYDKIASAAEYYGVNLIPGIEISTADYKSLHILGYGMNRRAPLDYLLSRNSSDNQLQLLRIIDVLKEQGIELRQNFIDRMLEHGSLGRKPIAKELVYMGYAKSKQDAYDRFVGPEVNPTTVTHKFTAEEVIKMITDAGGVPCLAHPRSIRVRGGTENRRLKENESEALVADLVKWGLRGIECLPSAYSPTQRKRKFLESIAGNFHLLTVGGTDFHGQNLERIEQLGHPGVTQEHVDALMNEIKIANARLVDF